MANEIVDTFPAKSLTRQFYFLNCDRNIGWILYSKMKAGSVQYIDSKQQIITSSSTHSLIVATDRVEGLRGYEQLILGPGETALNLYQWDLQLQNVPAGFLLRGGTEIELKTYITLTIHESVNGIVRMGHLNGTGVCSFQTDYAVVNIPMASTFGLCIASNASNTMPKDSIPIKGHANIDLKLSVPLSILLCSVTVRKEA
ncbi:MAG: hypothetical protein GXO10_02980 [Crenarchaeota archaeon]|nr:hypothetical protein [Thermoproteota archaeon]